MHFTKFWKVVFVLLIVVAGLTLNGWRVHKSLLDEYPILKKQEFDEQLKLEPAQTFFKLQKALRENNHKEIQTLTSPPFQQYLTNQPSIDRYKNVEVTEVVKGDENDYMLVIREVHQNYTVGSSVRVRNINGSWKITNSPACDPLPHDCGDKFDSDKRPYTGPQAKNIIDEISIMVFGVVGSIFWMVYLFGMLIIRR